MKILIVDDESLIRHSLERLFKARGHDVKSAADGEEGLKLYHEFMPDLMLLDVLMPGLTGPEVLARIGTPRNAKILMMSAFTGSEESLKDRENEPDEFVKKPFEDIFAFAVRCERLVK